VPFLAGQAVGVAELVVEVILTVSDGALSVVVVIEVDGCSDDLDSAVVVVDSSSIAEVDRV
jgi:hypothetical protein